MAATDQSLAGSAPDGAASEPLVRASTAMFDVIEDVAPVIARQMIARVPALGPVEDARAFDATRRSALGSMYELLCITRAGLTEPGMIETSPEALEHLRLLKHRGAGFKTVLGFYQIGVAMFEPLLLSELARFVPDQAALDRLAGPTRQFVFNYVDQITRRLAAEFGVERDDWVADPADPSWHDPDSVAVIERYIQQFGSGAPREAAGVSARRFTSGALERFVEGIQLASEDEQLSQVLSRADTTVRIELADDPGQTVTLLLDRQPVEVVRDDIETEISLWIVSIDLIRLYSSDFHLPMAVLRGRIRYEGPVRKFLRITPVVRHTSVLDRSKAAKVTS